MQAIDGAILSSLGTQDTTITAHSITLRAAGNIGTLLIPIAIDSDTVTVDTDAEQHILGR